MSETSRSKLYSQIKQFFDDDNWRYQELSNRPGVSLRYSGAHGSFDCYAYARDEQEQFVFYAVCSMKAPPDRRRDVAEFLSRANYGMIIGNFEIDFDDGEVRYKSAIDVEGEDLSFTLAKNVVYPAVLMMDKYFEGLMRVIYGAADPAAIIQEIENS